MQVHDQDLFDIIFNSQDNTCSEEETSSSKGLVEVPANADQEQKVQEQNPSAAEFDRQDSDFLVMQQNAYNHGIRELPKEGGIHRKFIRFLKRIVRKATRFYVEPVTEQQTTYNIAAFDAVQSLSQIAKINDNSIHAIKDVIADMNARIVQNGQLLGEQKETLQDQDLAVIAIQETLDEQSNSIKHIEEALDGDRNAATSIQRALEEERDTTASIQKALEEERDTTASIQRALEEERDTTASIQRALEEGRNTTATIQRALEEGRNTTVAIKSALEKQNGEITALYALHDDSSIKATLAEHSNSISAIKDAINDERDTSVAIKSVLEKQNDEITALRALRDELHIAFSRIANMENAAKQIDFIASQAYDNSILSYAQSGEDAILSYIFKALEISVNSIRYLDLGANHAKMISNTYALYAKGARGVLLEANPKLIPELSLYRSDDIIINRCLTDKKSSESVPFYILNGDGLSSFDKASVDKALSQNSALKIESIEKIPTITIEELINTYFPTAPEVLNIDLEGMERTVLGAIDFNIWRPLIIIIETIPYRPYLVHDEKQNELVSLLEKEDYTEYAFTGINSIMIDRKRLMGGIR